jgi:hypothetical protein
MPDHRQTSRQTMTINTMHAHQVAAPAADARPCAAAVRGDQWCARMGTGMGFDLMNATSIKRTARRLGKRAT